MLGSMRAKNTNQTLIWAILALLALGLVGFGGAGIGGGTIRSVGQVGEEKISVDVYAQSLNSSLSNLSQQLGRTVTASEAETMGLQGNVLQELLTTAALDNETRKLGISIGDEAVRTRLLANTAFQGLDGSFDKEAYEFALERARLTPKAYDEILRKEAARTFVQSAIVTGVKSQGTQTQALLAFDRETRDFTWAELTGDALAAPIGEPTDAQIQSQYEAVPGLYTAPLTREITYAWLSPDMLTDQVDIDEALIKESYDLQSDRFNKPEKRSVERIAFGSDAEATEARNLIDAGTATFNTILADRGLLPEDADLGEVERGTLSKEAAEVVFTADGPGVVGPVQTDLGPALFRINAILSEDITPFEDAHDEIKGELAGEAARRLVSDLVVDIDDLLAGGATVEQLADDTDMELGKISYTASTTGGIAAYEKFRQIAATTNVGDFPEINDLADGGIFALNVDAIKEPTLRPLAEVKDQVIADWKRAETVRQLTAQAETLKAELEKGAGFGDLETHEAPDTRRTGFIENTPISMLDIMFQIEAGKAAIAAGPDSVFIARLDQINAYDPMSAENQPLQDAVQDQLDGQIANDLLSTFAGALRDEAGVSLNQTAINQINAQMTGGQ